MPQKMERFTQRARRVLALAQEEAERLRHSYIGTEHLLIGLMREESGVASRVLSDLGVDLSRTEELVGLIHHPPKPSGETARLDLLPDLKKVLELAVDEARRMGHHYIGTEHLLLGLARQSKSTAMDILARLNVSPEEVRRQTRRVLQEQPPQASGLSTAPLTAQPIPNLAGNALTLALRAEVVLGHGYIGVWHLLLGLLGHEEGIAGRALRELGVDQGQVEEIVRGEPILGEFGPERRLMPAVQHVVEFAIDEARSRKDKYVRSEDLLLGLLKQNPGMFEPLNVSPDAIRAKIDKLLQDQNPPSEEPKADDPDKPSQ
jgi:ATP-dependent Clp protease ATP-binding subunit ClpA